MTAFALVKPCNVLVFDDKWKKLFKKGSLIRLPGGTEVEELEREEQWRVVRVNDIHFPDVVCRILERDAQEVLTLVEANSGPRTRGAVLPCGHNETDVNCLSC